jgi:hypothetical protein
MPKGVYGRKGGQDVHGFAPRLQEALGDEFSARWVGDRVGCSIRTPYTYPDGRPLKLWGYRVKYTPTIVLNDGGETLSWMTDYSLYWPFMQKRSTYEKAFPKGCHLFTQIEEDDCYPTIRVVASKGVSLAAAAKALTDGVLGVTTALYAQHRMRTDCWVGTPLVPVTMSIRA